MRGRNRQEISAFEWRVIMKRALFFFISIFFLGSCSNSYVTFSGERKNRTGQYKGYVILRNDTVFFVGDKTFETKVELQNYMEQQMNKEHPSDTVLSFKDKNAYDQLKTGDKINVWSSQILESYPAKMIVEKFELVEK